jgi:hypothetical protein
MLWNQYAGGKRRKSCEELPPRGSEGGNTFYIELSIHKMYVLSLRFIVCPEERRIAALKRK